MDAYLDDLEPSSSKEVSASNFKTKTICFCCFDAQHVVDTFHYDNDDEDSKDESPLLTKAFRVEEFSIDQS